MLGLHKTDFGYQSQLAAGSSWAGIISALGVGVKRSRFMLGSYIEWCLRFLYYLGT